MKKSKISILGMCNSDLYNYVDIEKSEFFLDNLQDFVVNVGLVKAKELQDPYEYNGKLYDMNTYYTLFYEDLESDSYRKLTIDEFVDGKIVRYFNKDIELLIIFFENEIKLIFYCNLQDRKKIINSLLNFGKYEKQSK